MSDPRIRLEEISKFLDSYDKKRFHRKKDVDKLLADADDGIVLLEDSLENWHSLLTQYERVTSELKMSVFLETESVADEVLTIAQQLLDYFVRTKYSILLPDLDALQEKVGSDMGRFLEHLVDLLEIYVPEKSSLVAPEIFFEQLIPLTIRSNKLAISANKSKLKNLKRKFTPKNKPSSSTRKWNPLTLRWLSLPLIAVIFLYLLDGWWPTHINDIVKLVVKFIIWGTFLLWFPTNFVPTFKESRVMEWSLYILIWAFFLLFWAYGVLLGMVIAIILSIPIIRLMSLDKRAIERGPLKVLDESIYRWGWLSMLLVGVITNENIWFIGGVIWWTFTLIAKISFKNFRFTFDMIEAVSQNQDMSALLRRRMIFFTLIATVLALFPGFLGQLHQPFVLEAYKQVATFSFGLIAILIGVQAIIPSITNWGNSSNQTERTATEIREMKLYLLHNRGLTGFMQIFFVIFLVSLIGMASSALVPASSVVVDLSIPFLLNPIPNIINVLGLWGSAPFSLEITRTFWYTMLFAVFTTLFFYSLAILYYLFIATNSLTIPIRDALISKPVLIEKVTIVDKTLEEKNLLAKIRRSLENARDLRGDVISELTLVLDDSEQPSCKITISEDFADTAQLVDKALHSFRSIFSVSEIHSAQVFISRMQSDSLLDRLFALDLTRKEFDFVKSKVEGMDTEYKMVQLGANIRRYQLPEAQIL